MTKKDVLELKKRLKKNDCTFTRICGCYVNADKEILLNFEESFLNLSEDELYKYLEIAKKVLSGTLGNNLLELEFPLVEEDVDGKQKFLMGLRESKLKNSEFLDTYYHFIIDHYDYSGNYLILIFHDAYDVISKTSDQRNLDESEEVYEYLLCAICPVELSKPGLGYLESEHRFGARLRDWVVDVPDTGFLFPAFTERSTDIHSILFYTKDTKEPHVEFIEDGLGCKSIATATQQKITFQSIIETAFPDTNECIRAQYEIHESLNQMIENHEDSDTLQQEALTLTSQSIREILNDHGIVEEITAKVEKSYEEAFAEAPPTAESLLDTKVLAESEKHKKERILIEQVQSLQKKLNATIDQYQEQINESKELSSEIIVKVSEEKAEQISSKLMEGKRCIIIPLEDNEQITINGVIKV